MSKLIIWFLQRIPAPERRAIYRAALKDLAPVRRREFLAALIAEEYGYNVHIHRNPRRAVNPAVSGVDE
jgi:hypothetical protein